MIIHVKASMGRYDNLLFRIGTRLKRLDNRKKFDPKAIPVLINNFNRLHCLQQQLEWLKAVGLRNIFIIDNASTYRPLLEFYRKTPLTVFQLDRNVGFEALWKTIIFQRFKRSYYIYTDPDILPDPACGIDAIARFYHLLQAYPQVQKVGFGLRLNDLPAHYPLKEKVLAWEERFWQKEIEKDVYEAPIDTTFALYRPGARSGSELPALRTGGKLTARHTTWYDDPARLTAEDIFYQAQAGRSASWTAELVGKTRNIHY